jgi:hypothetical protein
MQNIEHIESAIKRLSPQELREFRAWYATFDASLWDEAMERDILSGKLDALADEALSDAASGRCTEL